MKILITGTTSGIGAATTKLLKLQYHDVIELNRNELDLTDTQTVTEYNLPEIDCLINNAGGKGQTDQDTVNLNFLSPMILARKAYQQNPKVIIVNVTSSYVSKYWGNDLMYSVSKKALAAFRLDFKVDHPDAMVIEIRPGLTKQQYDDDGDVLDIFNDWRRENPDITFMAPEDVANAISQAIQKRKPSVYIIMPPGHTL
jgi:short-subunit dehydrogenase